MTEPRQEDTTDTELTGPGGWGVKYRGSNTAMLTIIIVLLIAGGLGYGIWQHEMAAVTRAVRTIERDMVATAAVKDLTVSVDKQEKKMDAIIYVLTLSDVERKALRLDKPQALREMQR